MSRLMFLMSRTNKETKLLRETSQSQLEIGLGFDSLSNCQFKDFSKFYGKAGVVSWLPFSHLKKLCSILRFWLKKLNCGFFTCFTREKTPQNNFPSQNFSVKITIPPITCYYLFNFLYYIYVYLNSVSVTSPNGKLLGNIPIFGALFRPN